jgi:hypothetical protein
MSNDTDRANVARAAVDALRHRDFRTVVTNSEGGEVRILATLWDDPVSFFFDKTERDRRPGFLVSITPTGGLAIIYFNLAGASAGRVDDRSHADDDECPVHPLAPIGMLFDYVSEFGRMRCTLHVPECEFELVQKGNETDVPV